MWVGTGDVGIFVCQKTKSDLYPPLRSRNTQQNWNPNQSTESMMMVFPFHPNHLKLIAKKNSHIKLNDSRSDLFHSSYKIFVCLVAQSCSTPCSPTDCSLPDSSVHGDSPSMNTEVGCHAPLLRIFPTQGSNPGLLHCRQILYCLNHQGSPIKVISK